METIMCEMNKTLNETSSRSDSMKGRTSKLEINNRNYLKQNTPRRENKKLNRGLVSCGTSLNGLTHLYLESSKERRGGRTEKVFDEVMAETFPTSDENYKHHPPSNPNES